MTIGKRETLLEEIVDRAFDVNCCFMCGVELSSDNATMEHVIPRWVQNRYSLWDQEIFLVNGTTIPYRQLTVPCCKKCNEQILQPIEVSVSKAVAQGPLSVRELPLETLFVWLGKIFYGLHYKELMLPNDRSSPSSGPISPPRLHDILSMHRFFLNNANRDVVFENFFPASILVYKCKTKDDDPNKWDLIDNLHGPFISIRMGDVGIISVLQDNQSFQGASSEVYEKLKNNWLHPIQFTEMAAQALYIAYTFNRKPRYIVVSDEYGGPSVVYSLPGLSCKPLYNEWCASDYCRVFSDISTLPFDYIFCKEQESYRSYTFDESGEFVDIDIDISISPSPRSKWFEPQNDLDSLISSD